MARVEGAGVVLREFRREDVPVIHEWVNDTEIVRFLSWSIFPQTLKETERFVEAQLEGTDPLTRAFVIALREGDRCIGTLGCHNIDWRSRVAEMGIVIGRRELLGKGHGTEATRLFLRFCFRELNLHRVFLRVFDFNERAIRSYLKCGFVEEGRLREAFFRNGEYHDVIVMGVLEDEFRAQSETPF